MSALNLEGLDLSQPRVKSNGWGGPRPNSGRKPGLAEQVKQELHEEIAENGRYALQLMAQIARDEGAPVKVRLEAARLLADRAFGKPRATVDVSVVDAPEPQVDHTLQAAMMADAELCEMAAEFDRRLALPHNRSEP